MRTYDKDKERLKKRRWRARHRKEYNEYQKLYKRKIRAAAKNKSKDTAVDPDPADGGADERPGDRGTHRTAQADSGVA